MLFWLILNFYILYISSELLERTTRHRLSASDLDQVAILPQYTRRSWIQLIKERKSIHLYRSFRPMCCLLLLEQRFYLQSRLDLVCSQVLQASAQAPLICGIRFHFTLRETVTAPPSLLPLLTDVHFHSLKDITHLTSIGTKDRPILVLYQVNLLCLLVVPSLVKNFQVVCFLESQFLSCLHLRMYHIVLHQPLYLHPE